jgi:regulator of protease activity HflC (stomatin/prohibitin superfamily)
MKPIKFLSVLSILFVLLLCTGCYDFNREQDRKDAQSEGQAILLKAESSKKAMIEEAKARSESSILAAKARYEVSELDAKAKAKKAEAEANYIEKVSAVLKSNPEYTKYLQTKSLESSKGDRVYISTESNIPILMK